MAQAVQHQWNIATAAPVVDNHEAVYEPPRHRRPTPASRQGRRMSLRYQDVTGYRDVDISRIYERDGE